MFPIPVAGMPAGIDMRWTPEWDRLKEARRFDDGDLHRVDELADEPHLLAQDVGGFRSGGFVGRDHLVAEGGLRPVERHDQLVGLPLLYEVHEHGGEPVDGVGHLPRGGGHGGWKGKKSAVSKGVPVKQHQQGHDLTPLWELSEYWHTPPGQNHTWRVCHHPEGIRRANPGRR